MKRYYSHYTFIYPDIFLRNHIVEIDTNNKIGGYFPFEAEIEKTAFYSGLLLFLPAGISLTPQLKIQIEKHIGTWPDVNIITYTV